MRRSKKTRQPRKIETKMPIYEYRCDNCGHELEAFQKLSEDPLRKCPDCNTESLVKKVSAAAFRLKGGGWYETDFKSGKKKNVTGAEDAPAKADGDKSAGDGKSASGSDSSSTSGKSEASAGD